jgi:hypothetical protein
LQCIQQTLFSRALGDGLPFSFHIFHRMQCLAR